MGIISRHLVFLLLHVAALACLFDRCLKLPAGQFESALAGRRSRPERTVLSGPMLVSDSVRLRLLPGDISATEDVQHCAGQITSNRGHVGPHREYGSRISGGHHSVGVYQIGEV